MAVLFETPASVASPVSNHSVDANGSQCSGAASRYGWFEGHGDDTPPAVLIGYTADGAEVGRTRL